MNPPDAAYLRTPVEDSYLEGARAVAVLSVDVDAESPVLARHPGAVADLSAMSHQAYGPLVGVPRILDLLDRAGAPATFFVPGTTAERWPAVVRDVIAAGHEVALHSHRHAPLVDMPAAEQARDLASAREALARAGAEPVGYRAPLWQLTEETLDLLLDAGLAYDSSLMDHDRPYLLQRGGRQIIELPVHWSLDDWEQYAFLPAPDIGQQIEPPSKVLQLWTDELDAMRRTGSLCLVTCHPFLSGRPSRLAVLERFLDFARQAGDVRLDTCAGVAASAVAAAGRTGGPAAPADHAGRT